MNVIEHRYNPWTQPCLAEVSGAKDRREYFREYHRRTYQAMSPRTRTERDMAGQIEQTRATRKANQKARMKAALKRRREATRGRYQARKASEANV